MLKSYYDATPPETALPQSLTELALRGIRGERLSRSMETLPTPVGAVLSDATIRELSNPTDTRPPLILPFREKLLEPASYDLTVGSECLMGSRAGRDAYSPEGYIRKFKDGYDGAIKPNEICMVITEEILTMPDNVCGRLSLPLGLLREGVFMAPQTQIDPGYTGRIVIVLYNLSNIDVMIWKGRHIATVEFLRLDRPSGKPYGDRNTYQGVVSLEGFAKKPLSSSLYELRVRVDSLQRWTMLMITFALALTAIMMALLVGAGLVKNLFP